MLLKDYRISPLRCAAAAGTIGTIGAIGVAGKLVISALGFGPGGIGADTPAAKIMSWSAIWNGGGVPPDGLVAFLQSLGAKDLTVFAQTYVGKILITAGCLIAL